MDTNKSNLDLSIIIPAAPGRFKHLRSVLFRLALNKTRHPDINFEICILDGGSKDDTQKLCKKIRKYIPLKYVFMPVNKFINACWLRNILVRISSGKIICMLDVDHWPGEDLIAGIMEPYKHGNFNYINRGYVIDTIENKRFGPQGVEKVNNFMTSDRGIASRILDVYEFADIPRPKLPPWIWLAAAPRENIIKMRGWDERFILAYSREDDDYYWRLVKSGLQEYNSSFREFSALHMFHPAKHRQQKENKLNREYYIEMGSKNPTIVVRNTNRKWGKCLRGSFAILNNEYLSNTEKIENWINDNVKDVEAYFDDIQWESLEECKKYGH